MTWRTLTPKQRIMNTHSISFFFNLLLFSALFTILLKLLEYINSHNDKLPRTYAVNHMRFIEYNNNIDVKWIKLFFFGDKSNEREKNIRACQSHNWTRYHIHELTTDRPMRIIHPPDWLAFIFHSLSIFPANDVWAEHRILRKLKFPF